MYLLGPTAPAFSIFLGFKKWQCPNDTAQQNEHRKAIGTKPETCLYWETGPGLGKGDVCSAGVTEKKHIEETSQKLLVLKCHNPGRARLLGKNLAEAAISKDGIFPASDFFFFLIFPAGSSFLSFFFTLAKPTLSLPSFSHPRLAQEGGEESSTPLLQRHRAPVGPGAETEYFGRSFLADPRLAGP